MASGCGNDGNDGMLQVRAKRKAMGLNKERPTVGIDFGTTYCSLAVIEGNIATITVRLHSGPLIGDAEKELFPMNPENTISGITWFVHTTVSIIRSKYLVPFGLNMIESLHEDASLIKVTSKGVEKHLSTEGVFAFIIDALKKRAEESLGFCIVDVACAFPNKLEKPWVDGIQNAIAFANLRVSQTYSEVIAVIYSYGRVGDPESCHQKSFDCRCRWDGIKGDIVHYGSEQIGLRRNFYR